MIGKIGRTPGRFLDGVLYDDKPWITKARRCKVGISPSSAYMHQDVRLLHVQKTVRGIRLVETQYIWGSVLNDDHLAVLSE
jgi:hypothetical protein